MDKVIVKVINKGINPLPQYETMSAAGMDVRASLKDPVVLKPMQRALIPTGLHVELPKGYELQVRPRSGLALKSGISVVNSPGTVDADYRGEIGVILINLSDTEFTVNPGERIAQLVVTRYSQVEWEPTDHLSDTVRGDGAFGHTGVE